MSSEILILLTFNCYVNYKGVSETYNNFKHYKLLVERYSMLEHLSWSFVSDRNRKSLPILLNSYNANDCAFGTNVKYAYKALEKSLTLHMLNFISNVEVIVNIDGNIRESNNEKDKINSMYYGNKYKIEGYNEVVKLMEIIESRDISLFKDKGIDWRYMSKFESRIKNIFTDIETPNLLIYDEHKGVASVEEIDEKFLASVDYMLKGLFL